MKFSFLGLEIMLTRQQSKEACLALSDVKLTNDELVHYIQNLANQDIADRIQSVICTVDQGEENIKKTLSSEGVVIIPDFIPKNILKDVALELSEIREKISAFMSTGQSVNEEESVLFQQGNAKLSGYVALSGYGKTVVQVRHGQDQGMIDIFNIDEWQASLGERLRPYFEQQLISQVMDMGDARPEARNLNLYLNNGVTQTRGFHVDSYSKQLKGFVYLEDCLRLDDGPYTYVKKSHLESSFTRINKHISSVLPNNTETPCVPLRNIVPILAKKGALVISDQGGSHRGFPQSMGHQRAVAVMNFR
ncbi:hypothetical protein [Marinobacter sp. F3R11]|uniref:hypothetical protein n=1 Tax=Marinobacter sp. F3R11 TaxID=2267231 RepID=UPI000DEA7D88|nr:hypothetical protein [Marinobacter sp. F3R11]RBW48270.1 hypothetical protein DS878_08685 [Marinobacter sp. F3R11]